MGRAIAGVAVVALLGCGKHGGASETAGSAAPASPDAAPPPVAASECASPGACRPACEAGDLSACTWLGQFHVSDPGGDGALDDRGVKIAVPLLEKACDGGDADGCIELTRALHVGSILARTPLDAARVDALRARACKIGDGRGCDDPRVAIAALDRACTGGDARACFLIVDAYDGAVDTSGSTEPNLPALTDRIRGAISNHSPVAPDKARAKALMDRGVARVDEACTRGQARTCALSIPHEILKSKPYARHQDRACTAGASTECLELGHAARTTDVAAYVAGLTRACELGDPRGCTELGTVYAEGADGIAIDPARSIELLTRGCDAHGGAACLRLGERYARGTDVAKDRAKARALYQRACELAIAAACKKLGKR